MCPFVGKATAKIVDANSSGRPPKRRYCRSPASYPPPVPTDQRSNCAGTMYAVLMRPRMPQLLLPVTCLTRDLSTAQPNSGAPWRIIKAGADLIGARCCDALAFGDCGPVQAMCWPPFAAIVAPVMNPASSLARNATHFAISSGVPSRPTGICAVMLSRTFSGMAATISVLI